MPFFMLRLIPPPTPERGNILITVESRNSGERIGPFIARTALAADGAMIANPTEAQGARAWFDLLMRGDDCLLHVVADPHAQLLPLPLPVGSGFSANASRVMTT